MKLLVKGQGITPRVQINDKLRSYDAAKKETCQASSILGQKPDNWAENSHLSDDGNEA